MAILYILEQNPIASLCVVELLFSAQVGKESRIPHIINTQTMNPGFHTDF